MASVHFLCLLSFAVRLSVSKNCDQSTWYCPATDACIYISDPCNGTCTEGWVPCPEDYDSDGAPTVCSDGKHFCKGNYDRCLGSSSETRQFCESVDPSSVPCYSEDQLRCTGRRPAQCIEPQQRCDGVYHCMDLSDETDCDLFLKEEESHFSEQPFDEPLCHTRMSREETLARLTVCSPAKKRGNMDGVFFGAGKNMPCVHFSPLCLGAIGQWGRYGQQYRQSVARRCPSLGRLLGDEDDGDGYELCRDGEFWQGKECSASVADFARCKGNLPSQCYQHVYFERSPTTDSCYCKGSCSPDNRPVCKDMSHFVCELNQVTSGVCFNDTSNMWPCRDNRTCVHESLVCDGYIQCEDGSDEDPYVCSECPKEFGFAYSGPPKAATFQCAHRYTGRPICSVPCNGKDDFCRDMQDERWCDFNVSFSKVGVALLAIGILFVILGEVAVRTRVLEVRLRKEEEWRLASEMDMSTEQKLYKALLDEVDGPRNLGRARKRQRKAIYKLVWAMHGEDRNWKLLFFALASHPEKSKELIAAFLAADLTLHRGSLLIRRRCLKGNLGTSDLTKKVLDVMEPTTLTKIKAELAQKLDRWLNFAKDCSEMLKRVFTFATFYLKALLYYADLVKDFLTIYVIFSGIGLFSPNFSVLVLSVLAGSFLLTEVANAAHLVSHWNLVEQSVIWKVALCMLPPLIPATVMFQMTKWDLYKKSKEGTKVEVLSSEEVLENQRWIVTCDDKIKYWRRFLADLRKNENILEHSVQLLVPLLLVGLSASKTSTVKGGFQALFAGSTFYVAVLSSVWSFATLLRGAVAQQVIKKDSFMGINGILLLAMFYLLSTAARLSAILLFFCPSLGLLSLLTHLEHGKLPVEARDFFSRKLYIYDVDYSTGEAQFKHFSQVWKQTEEATDYTLLTSKQCFWVLLVMCLLHIVIVSTFKRRTCWNFRHSKKVRAWQHVMESLLHPTVFMEWDGVGWRGMKYDDDPKLFRHLWRKNRNELLLMISLLALEHLLMCFPMWMLLFTVLRRNAYLEEYFSLTQELEEATSNIWLLSVLPPVLFVSLVPALQYLVMLAYYRYGHPWSSLFAWEVQNSARQNYDNYE